MFFNRYKKRSVTIKLGNTVKKIKDIDSIVEIHVHDSEKCHIIFIRRTDGKSYMIYDNPEHLGYSFYKNDYYVSVENLEAWGNTKDDLNRYLYYADSGWYCNDKGFKRYQRLDSNYRLFVDMDKDVAFYVDDDHDFHHICMKDKDRWVPLVPDAMDYFKYGRITAI